MVSSLLGLTPGLSIQRALFGTCDIFEFVNRCPRGNAPVRELVIYNHCCRCLSPIGTFVRSRVLRLFRVIFVIYAHDGILPDSGAWKPKMSTTPRL